MGGLQTESRRMVIQHFQDSVVIVTIIDWQMKVPKEVTRC